MTYKTKTMTVDAIRIEENNDLEVQSFMERDELKYHSIPELETFAIVVDTDDGEFAVMEGDYIIKTAENKFIPVPESMFNEFFREIKI